jgi:hypothetical protein
VVVSFFGVAFFGVAFFSVAFFGVAFFTFVARFGGRCGSGSFIENGRPAASFGVAAAFFGDAF